MGNTRHSPCLWAPLISIKVVAANHEEEKLLLIAKGCKKTKKSSGGQQKQGMIPWYSKVSCYRVNNLIIMLWQYKGLQLSPSESMFVCPDCGISSGGDWMMNEWLKDERMVEVNFSSSLRRLLVYLSSTDRLTSPSLIFLDRGEFRGHTWNLPTGTEEECARWKTQRRMCNTWHREEVNTIGPKRPTRVVRLGCQWFRQGSRVKVMKTMVAQNSDLSQYQRVSTFKVSGLRKAFQLVD